VKAILPIHAVREHLNLSSFPEQLIHVYRFGGEDSGVLELDLMAQTYAAFSHSQFIYVLQVDVSLVVLNPGLNGTASLPNADSTTFAGPSLHGWTLLSLKPSFTG
jgi:hypothetical protein